MTDAPHLAVVIPCFEELANLENSCLGRGWRETRERFAKATETHGGRERNSPRRRGSAEAATTTPRVGAAQLSGTPFSLQIDEASNRGRTTNDGAKQRRGAP